MKELERIYRKRRNQLLPLVFGFAAFFVFMKVLLPQWTDIQDIQQLVTTKNEHVKIKEDNLLLLKSIPDEKIDVNYVLATTALPVQKDVILIFSELDLASKLAGVKLGGFSLKVGGVYSSDGQTQNLDKTIDGIPYLSILVNVSGEGDALRKFADEMYKTLPLTEINNVDISKRDARYDVNFYFKPITARVQNEDIVSLSNLSASEEKRLKELDTWNKGIPSTTSE